MIISEFQKAVLEANCLPSMVGKIS